MDVVVTHASAKSYAAQAAKEAGLTAARAERTNRKLFRKDVSYHAAFRFVPLARGSRWYGTCIALGRLRQRPGAFSRVRF